MNAAVADAPVATPPAFELTEAPKAEKKPPAKKSWSGHFKTATFANPRVNQEGKPYTSYNTELDYKYTDRQGKVQHQKIYLSKRDLLDLAYVANRAANQVDDLRDS